MAGRRHLRRTVRLIRAVARRRPDLPLIVRWCRCACAGRADPGRLLVVVMDPLPDLADLIWAFEGEPRYAYEVDDNAAGYELDWRETWPYTRVVFALNRGPRHVRLTYSPAMSRRD